ncbi:MAG: hypothetical protein N2246_05160 [Candidatus Sumerlaeia bacterium]|nr:hypothetical protein [Candidatus Sumerlaeia bacterium]
MKPLHTPPYFIGHFLMSIDAKNRIILPPIFRDILKTHYKNDNNTVVESLSVEGIINVYPLSSYIKMVEKMQSLPEFLSNVNQLSMTFSATGFYQQVDTAGRIAIRSSLLEKANIKDEAYIVGRWHYFQIWPKDKFETAIDTYIPQLQIISDKIFK